MSFLYYQSIIIRSPFFKETQPEPSLKVNGGDETQPFLVELEEKADRFAYRGSVIVKGKQEVAIEERRRCDEGLTE